MNTQPAWIPQPPLPPAPANIARPRPLHNLAAVRAVTAGTLVAGVAGLGVAVALLLTGFGSPCSPPPQVALAMTLAFVAVQPLALGLFAVTTRMRRGGAVAIGLVGGVVLAMDLSVLLPPTSSVGLAGLLVGGISGYLLAERDAVPARRGLPYALAGGGIALSAAVLVLAIADNFCLNLVW